MNSIKTFDEVRGMYFKKLSQYVPIVDRVHGDHHPEFHDVRQVVEVILEKSKGAGKARPELTLEFEELRKITSNYTVPADVCETFEAVYHMLEEVDKAYHS